MEIFRSYRRQKEAIVSFNSLVWQLCQQNTHCTLTQKTQELQRPSEEHRQTESATVCLDENLPLELYLHPKLHHMAQKDQLLLCLLQLVQ